MKLLLATFMFTLYSVSSRSVFDNKFMETRNKKTFVDKTLLVEEFMRHKYLFVNAPSKFGKSTNLDMISLFLGNQRPKDEIEKYFKDTKLWNSNAFVKQNLGEHPIVHFNLKIVGASTVLDNILTAFKVAVYNAISDHMYLFDSEKISDDQRKMLEIYADLTSCRLVDANTVSSGLNFLVEVLHTHHGKPVILLADEYGRGISEGIIHNKKDLPAIVEWYSSVLNKTFANENLIAHALISGENWLYGVKSPVLPKFKLIPFMQSVEFITYFGFTHDEVKDLLVKFDLSHNFDEVIKWYGGYTSSDGLFKLANPFSISEYFAYKKESVYWTGSALADELIGIMVGEESLKAQVVHLVLRNTVEVDLKKDIRIDDILLLKNQVEQLPQYCENFFFRLLVEAGYLTFAEPQPNKDKTTVRVANEEVQSAMVSYTL
ncbi:uncharacterized protein LOC128986949 [Macrosteles quadrilineatus]|uniref:uncharacterized protein LOC128986949 n=1 Tax=Macrosteles quadrilineatus TaxID=74068 RepID=UPI0023E30ECF|nr:uncharacterized protein LOC128986949 [Macrosteles quadrilineatus]